ncbi:triose-phosphate isomerase [Rhizobium tubonense]|uniref:triose-phosphate isomerase family protein n=1 Tax=Rhizobium tubonense TaxID=484088 RepID=UPI001FCF133E|nr:triose-phosphate isomerase [Rhizobium tubonense]
MRKLIAGNWKMNGLASSRAEIEALKGLAGETTCDIVVCRPLTLVGRAMECSKGSTITIGAQDCHPEVEGAYTGDVSADMLAEIGARYVILGHSERRTSHGEDGEMIARKVAAAHRAGLVPIVCVGETGGERDEGRAIEVVDEQRLGSIPTGATCGNLAIADEPV